MGVDSIPHGMSNVAYEHLLAGQQVQRRPRPLPIAADVHGDSHGQAHAALPAGQPGGSDAAVGVNADDVASRDSASSDTDPADITFDLED
eukprot:746298-Alexandrium_andersonii.AAC.1